MVTALIIQPNQHPQITQLCDDRCFLDLSVSRGTDCICSAATLPLADGLAVLYPQQGAMLCLPGNRKVNGHIIAGTFYIVGAKDGALRSLTDAEITKYTLQFWEPEIFSEDEVLDSYFDHILTPL